ncbi:FkbM family methyltransferase [Chromobacterium piscinae]|uniref:FkbM family methyltransferase n=1 Tax=Chromobacterium piscinae TaxID=686831 RepID=UPI001E5952EF|nr:FkbM family methyltransferase [Chromobacterium piscinae]MCD5327938.1 FkbM family methyltransferase [Chromobacterium piscinae]
MKTKTPSPAYAKMVKKCRHFGLQQKIRERWALDPIFPEPNDQERAFFQELDSMRHSSLIIESSGIRVRLGPDIPTWITYLLLCDAYEHGDIRLIADYVRPGERTLVIGGGIGVIAAEIAQKSALAPTIIEANPLLLERLNDTAELNGVAFDIIHGVVQPGCISGLAPFHISEEFWASSLREDTWRKTSTVEVPIVDLETVLTAPYDVVFLDIEGAEVGLLEMLLLPKTVKTLFVEIHRPLIGGRAEAAVMNRLWDQGFKLVDSEGLTGCWQRML